MRRQILLVTVITILIILSCVVVAFVTNYLVNKKQVPEKTATVSPAILHEVNMPKSSVIAKLDESRLQPAIPLKGFRDKRFTERNTAGVPKADFSEQISAKPAKALVAVTSQLPIVAVSSTLPIEPPTGVSTQPPDFTPVTNTTGPVPPPSIASTQTTPTSPADFVPISNTTGPIPPNGSQQKSLPPFTPVTNTTGPVKTDAQ